MRTLALALLATQVACSKHYLEEYRFSDRTLGVSFIEPPEAELKHGWYNVDPGGNALQNVVQAGAKVVKEVEARRALSRLDSAERSVDLTELLANGTAQRASRYLGTRAATDVDAADFVLEVHMREFGIDATSNNATYLYSRAEAVLIDRRTGREIWSKKVRGERSPDALHHRHHGRAERDIHGRDAAHGHGRAVPARPRAARGAHVEQNRERAAFGPARRQRAVAAIPSEARNLHVQIPRSARDDVRAQGEAACSRASR